MQAGIERRARDAHRVPLDMLVRLTHEDFEEPFDADGVDVSTGGIALRADYLPKVGDRLRCRLDGPEDGSGIELDGEVVWAHDAGERSGEFGLRFATMDVEAERALKSTIARLRESLGDGADRERARLHLEGVATPIEGEVVDRDEHRLKVEQELPFLRIGMNVAVEGRGPAHGKLAAVDLRMDEGVPRLLLVVEEAAPSEDDATLRDYELEERVSALRDDTLDAHGPALTADASSTLDADVGEPAEEEHAPVEAAEELERTPLGESEQAAAPVEMTTAEEAALKAEPVATPEPPTAERPAWVSGLVEHASELKDRTRPALAALWAKLTALWAVALAKGSPRAKAAWAKSRSVLQGLASKATARVGRKGKRRTTSAPPTRTAAAPRLRRQREKAQAAPKRKAGVLVLSALAFAGVGASVYALTAPEPEPAPPPLVVQAPEPPVAAPASPDVPTALPIEPAPEEVPAAAAEPEGGPLAAPTFPTLPPPAQAEAPSAPTEPASAPNTTTHFGADEVPNGRSRTIRMSQPVTALRGEAQSDGFTVTIPGSLALEGARGIAATNPSVDQSMILNRGDHSVLTVRFVAGQSPPYRVVAKGAAIEVTIGR